MSGPAPPIWISWKLDQNCDLYRNFLYIYISILTLRIRNQGPSKRKTWPPPPPPSEVEGVRIVVISFRNIAKKEKFDFITPFSGSRRRIRNKKPFFTIEYAGGTLLTEIDWFIAFWAVWHGRFFRSWRRFSRKNYAVAANRRRRRTGKFGTKNSKFCSLYMRVWKNAVSLIQASARHNLPAES